MWAGGIGGDEAKRGVESHPGLVFSSCLAEAGTRRLEKFLPLNAEVPIRALQSPSCPQLLSHLG